MTDPNFLALRRAWPTHGAPAAGTDAIDTLTFANIESGTFRLKIGGQTTTVITWTNVNNDLRDAVDAALEALQHVDPSGVVTAVGTMTDGLGTLTVTWVGHHAKDQGAPNIVVVKKALVGEGADITVERTTPGVSAFRRRSPVGSYAIDLGAGAVYIATGTRPAVWSLVD